jgi:hypothetical protein
MLIKVYGEFWSRQRVDWSKKQLAGVRKGKRGCNLWEERGIYALYDRFKIVYVGQADSRGIGIRLNEHCTDRFGERWDSFSFFGICPVAEDGTVLQAGQSSANPEDVIRSLELIAILLSDAPLNRARGRFPGSEKVWQVDAARPSKALHLDKQLAQMEKSIANLRHALAAKNRRTKKDEG